MTFAVLAMGVGAFALLQSLVIPVLTTVQQWQIYVSSGLMGIGFGLAFSAMSALIVAAVPPSQTGVASGMNAGITTDDVITLVSAMRGLIHTVPGATPDAWPRFLDLHLADMTAPC